MRENYAVLIIDDHPIIVEAYKNVLESFNPINSGLKFNIDTANTIDSAVTQLKGINFKRSIDLIILDINLPPSKVYKLNSGEELGVYIKERMPNVKFMVITSNTDDLRLSNIFSNLNPDGFLIKTDITHSDLLLAIKIVISGSSFYSKTVKKLLHKKASQKLVLDHIDIEILCELSNGSKMKELMQLIPLTKSGIEKRKRLLKEKFKINGNSDRDLVLTAKKNGYI